MATKTLSRCSWSESKDPIYAEYHDNEWGVPIFDDDRKHFEMLTLESAQAGLSWLTVLRKRDGYRKAFADFDPTKVARFTSKRIEKLLSNPAIIRNRQKVSCAVSNAKAFLEVQDEVGSFSQFIWQFVGGQPIQNRWKTINQLPATSKQSDALSKELKQRGFKFVGSTTMYAHMQAAGLVNDHLVTCFRHKPCAKLAKQRRRKK
jgi:DNA-3-methyladenine glycosylase I